MKTKTISKPSSKNNLLLAFFFLVFTAITFSSFAATVILKDGHDGKWETAANWVIPGGAAYGSLPKSGDFVQIPSSITNPKLSISSKVTIQKLQVKTLTLTIEKNGVLNVKQGSDLSIPAISLATGSIVNNGTFAVYAGAVVTSHNLIQLDGDASATSSTLTNNGKLIFDNSAAVGTENKTATLSCISYNQTTAGATPSVTLNQSGTITLNLKESAPQSATAGGFNPVIFNVSPNVKGVLSGTFTFGSQSNPLLLTKLLNGGNGNTTLTIPAGSNITSYHEGIGGGMFMMYSGNLINAGTITLNAPSATGINYGVWAISGINNSGTINIEGNIMGKAVTLNERGTAAAPAYLINSGTFTVNVTGKAVALSSYSGSTSGAWVPGTSVAKQGVFQLTNSGTMTINSGEGATMAIAVGNADPNSWFKNSGTVKLNNAITSGFTTSAKSADGNFYSAPASSPMKIYNSGTFVFDLPSGSYPATKESFGTADGTTSNVNYNYSKPLFVNQYNGVGGTVKGKGRFISDSFDTENSKLGKIEQ